MLVYGRSKISHLDYNPVSVFSGLLTSKSSEWMEESEFHNVSASTPKTKESTASNESNHREDKLDMETESLPDGNDLYLSSPTSNHSSPPSSPKHRDASPTKEKEKHDNHDKSPRESR